MGHKRKKGEEMKVTGRLVHEFTREPITKPGVVVLSDENELMRKPLESDGSFVLEDVPEGAYVVSIVNVEGFFPANKLLDVFPGEDVDLGEFNGKVLRHGVFGTDY